MDVIDWGEINYPAACEAQLDLVEKRIEGNIEDTLVFCSHPPVVTLGRGSSDSDVLGWKGETFKSPRGGKATYHGPSQQVAYPITKLVKKDLHLYLNKLEDVLVKTLSRWGIQAQPGSSKNEKGSPSFTGVWVEDKKVASIGIAVKSWVTYHGLALNLYEDERAFQGINPCGFNQKTMTSVEAFLGEKPPRKECQKFLLEAWESL